MTVRRGQDWGTPGRLQPGEPVVSSDAELACTASRVGPATTIGLTGGDLHRTLGCPHRDEDDLRRDGGTLLVVDLGEAIIERRDGQVERVPFAGHVVARAGRGPMLLRHTYVAMNSAFVGPENLGPRAHPGDGTLDVLEGGLGLWDWMRSRGRRRSGTHVPHPALRQRRTGQESVSFPRGARVAVDGIERGVAVAIGIEIREDAARVLI